MQPPKLAGTFFVINIFQLKFILPKKSGVQTQKIYRVSTSFKHGSATYQQNTVAFDFIIIIQTSISEIFSWCDLKWVLLVEPSLILATGLERVAQQEC